MINWPCVHFYRVVLLCMTQLQGLHYTVVYIINTSTILTASVHAAVAHLYWCNPHPHYRIII